MLFLLGTLHKFIFFFVFCFCFFNPNCIKKVILSGGLFFQIQLDIEHKYPYALLRVLFAPFKSQTSYAVYVKVIKTVQREFQGQMKGQIDYLVCSKHF